MISLLSKLFGTTTPRVRKSTSRARLGVESLDGRIMPMTFAELQLIITHPVVAPRPALVLEGAATRGGQMAATVIAVVADSSAVSLVAEDASHINGWGKIALHG